MGTNLYLYKSEGFSSSTGDLLRGLMIVEPSPLGNVFPLAVRKPHHFFYSLDVKFWNVMILLKSGLSRIQTDLGRISVWVR